jgi:hypothetical protein
LRALQVAAKKVASATYSDDCLSDIHALKNADGTQLSAVSVRDQAKNEVFADATTASAQSTIVFPSGKTVTASISSFFDPNSPNYLKGISAFTPFSASTSYWLPGDTSSTDYNVLAGAVMHELLHSLGFTDSAIQKAFGLAVTDLTENISKKLTTDCFGSH